MSILTNWKKNQTSGLFGRMLAKHLNSRKERAQANDTGDSRIQPTKESSNIGVSQNSEACGKKTAVGFPDEDTRRELADMLDNGSDFGGDESVVYEGYRGKDASDIGLALVLEMIYHHEGKLAMGSMVL